MTSDARRRQRPGRPRRAVPRPGQRPRPSTAARAGSAPKRDDISKSLISVLVIAWFGVFLAVDHVVGGYADAARWVTGGNEAAMAVAGWLVFFAPFGLGWVLVLFRKRLGPRRTQVIGGVALFLTPITLALLPTTENGVLLDTADGAGGAAFIAGVLNGALAAVVPCAVVPFIALNSRLRDTFGDRLLRNALIPPVVAFLAATLIAAIIFGQS